MGFYIGQLPFSRMVYEEGYHRVLVHGAQDYFIINGQKVSADILARLLIEDGYKKGTMIRLVSCHCAGYEYGAAYQLSRYMKSQVTAPTVRIRVLEGEGLEREDLGGIMARFPQ